MQEPIKRIEFTLPGLPKTYNALAGSHYRAKHGEMSKWFKEVYAALNSLGVIVLSPSPWAKAKLTLTRRSSIAPDPDGLVSSFKYIVDALVKCGVLKDDKMTVIGFPDYRWEKAPKQKGSVHVVVEKIGENQ